MKLYLCPQCQKPIRNGEEVTSIMSGSAYNIHKNEGADAAGMVDDVENTIVFHDACFLEAAGVEFYPRIQPSEPENDPEP